MFMNHTDIINLQTRVSKLEKELNEIIKEGIKDRAEETMRYYDKGICESIKNLCHRQPDYINESMYRWATIMFDHMEDVVVNQYAKD